jgi:hypothetical protein
VLLRALQAGGISEFLGIEYTGDPAKAKCPVPSEKMEAFEFFVRTTFGTDERPPIVILQSQESVRYLKTARKPSFDRAWIKSGGQQSNVSDVLNAAADNIEDAIPLLPDFKDDQEIIEALRRCARRLSQALRDFRELLDLVCNDQPS